MWIDPCHVVLKKKTPVGCGAPPKSGISRFWQYLAISGCLFLVYILGGMLYKLS